MFGKKEKNASPSPDLDGREPDHRYDENAYDEAHQAAVCPPHTT